MCCSAGAVELPIANDTPEPIRMLLTETRVNGNDKVVWTNRTAHFQQYIRSYNNSIAFTSLGAKLDRQITDTLIAQGVYTFRIHGALHHSMGSLLPPPGERPRFAQVYLYDSAEEQLQYRHETHCKDGRRDWSGRAVGRPRLNRPARDRHAEIKAEMRRSIGRGLCI
jgi:hypothetical protein